LIVDDGACSSSTNGGVDVAPGCRDDVADDDTGGETVVVPGTNPPAAEPIGDGDDASRAVDGPGAGAEASGSSVAAVGADDSRSPEH